MIPAELLKNEEDMKQIHEDVSRDFANEVEVDIAETKNGDDVRIKLKNEFDKGNNFQRLYIKSLLIMIRDIRLMTF
jgi:hypothetical protein